VIKLEYQYRSVNIAGKSPRGKVGYSLYSVLPKCMTNSLGIVDGDILRFSIDNRKRLIVERVEQE
jgi:antitoxin component of MazEF toxin-antitoxin module